MPLINATNAYYVNSTSNISVTGYNNTTNDIECAIVCANSGNEDSQQGLPIPQSLELPSTANNEGCLSDVEYSRRDFIDRTYV
jgi:hypothetical protein